MQIMFIHAEAVAAAKEAVKESVAKWTERYGSAEVAGACGFAWVNLYGVKLSTKIGKEFEAVGFRKSYHKGLEIYNPSGYPGQNVDVKEAGAVAYAKVLEKYGYKAYAASRLD